MITISDFSKRTNIYKKASDLLNYCLKNRQVGIDSNTRPFIAFINAAYQEPDFSRKWSIADIYNLLNHAIETFIGENRFVNPPVTEQLVIDFIERFHSLMSNNLVEYWLIFPLMRANVDSLVQFNDFIVIPEKLGRDEKIEYLANLISISKDEMNYRANHTEKTRSPSFYEYTLFCHKVCHYPSWVSMNASPLVLLDIAVLRTITNSGNLADQNDYGWMLEDRREINKHVLIHTKEPANWVHEPIWANENSTVVIGNLSWLQNPVQQNKFAELVGLIGYEEKIDRLAYRIRRSVLLYSKSVDIQLNNHRASEGLGLELLHLLIAAEGLLLERENEKRRRLAALLSKLVQVDGKESHEIYNAVDDIYNWRSDYVHEGNDVFPEYDEDFNEGETLQKIYLLRYVVSSFLADSSKWIQIAVSRIQKSTDTQLSYSERDVAWFNYLREIWNVDNSRSSSHLVVKPLMILKKIISRITSKIRIDKT